jgi:hypothetical protein
MITKQILITIAIIAAISAVMVTIPAMAQMVDNASMGNLTVGNMTGGNTTGGNMTTGVMSGQISGYEEDAECSKSPACIS